MKKRGWTFIESLVVLAILGILTALALPVISIWRDPLPGSVVVAEKYYKPTSVVVVPVFGGKHTGYAFAPHPPSWQLRVTWGQSSRWIEVSEYVYRTTHVGQLITREDLYGG